MRPYIRPFVLIASLGIVVYLILAIWTYRRGGAYPWNTGATRWIMSYRTEIEFYGKVVDQSGDPVSEADVQIIVNDNPFGEDSSPPIRLKTDAAGQFSVRDLKGLAMGVDVTKEGYLSRPVGSSHKPPSYRRIEYGLDGTGGAKFKDSSNPTLFQLHKLGPMEPLVWVDKKQRKLPFDGTPHLVALDSENGRGSHQIEFRLRSERAMQLSSNEPFVPRVFAWDFEMKIPGGGFIESKSDFNLEAPEEGYQESIGISYTKETPDWKRSFCKLPVKLNISD